MEFKKYLDEGYSSNYISGDKATITRSGVRTVSTSVLTDGKADTYWAAPVDTTYSIVIRLDKPVAVNCLMMQEYIRLGQRIDSYSIELETAGRWQQVAAGATIGYKKLIRFPDTPTTAVKITLNSALASPVLAEMALYRFPDIAAVH
jgi:alpha-L-fucosidase